jgi:hypothetical protein
VSPVNHGDLQVSFECISENSSTVPNTCSGNIKGRKTNDSEYSHLVLYCPLDSTFTLTSIDLSTECKKSIGLSLMEETKSARKGVTDHEAPVSTNIGSSHGCTPLRDNLVMMVLGISVAWMRNTGIRCMKHYSPKTLTLLVE